MTNIDPSIAQRQADFIEELEEKLAELKAAPEPDVSSGSAVSEQEPVVRLNVDIPKSLHKRFRSLCFSKDANMTEVLRSFVVAYVEEHSGK